LELIELEKQAWAVQKAFMAANNPDAALFND
jgi:hypothetical protein